MITLMLFSGARLSLEKRKGFHLTTKMQSGLLLCEHYVGNTEGVSHGRSVSPLASALGGPYSWRILIGSCFFRNLPGYENPKHFRKILGYAVPFTKRIFRQNFSHKERQREFTKTEKNRFRFRKMMWTGLRPLSRFIKWVGIFDSLHSHGCYTTLNKLEQSDYDRDSPLHHICITRQISYYFFGIYCLVPFQVLDSNETSNNTSVRFSHLYETIVIKSQWLILTKAVKNDIDMYFQQNYIRSKIVNLFEMIYTKGNFRYENPM